MLIELLEGMITMVDQKIKRSIQRIEMPMPDSAMMPEISQFQQETTHQRIDQIEQKINFYIENAEKLGEDG